MQADSARPSDSLRYFDAQVIAAPGAPFPFWLISATGAPSDAMLALLSPAERDRANRFRNASLRDRYVAAHVALRHLCERMFGISAPRQRFAADALGKLHLLDCADAQCSISYSGDHALIAAARGKPIGVDMEALRPIADASDLMADHFTVREQALLARVVRMGVLNRDEAFLRLWVRKEACVKALAKGLTVPLSSLELGIVSKAMTVRHAMASIRTGIASVGDRIIMSPGDPVVRFRHFMPIAARAGANVGIIRTTGNYMNLVEPLNVPFEQNPSPTGDPNVTFAPLVVAWAQLT